MEYCYKPEQHHKTARPKSRKAKKEKKPGIKTPTATNTEPNACGEAHRMGAAGGEAPARATKSRYKHRKPTPARASREQTSGEG